MLRRAADLIEARCEEFVAAEVADTGKPVTLARGLDVARAVANFRTFADVVGVVGQESFLTDLPGGRHALNCFARAYQLTVLPLRVADHDTVPPARAPLPGPCARRSSPSASHYWHWPGPDPW